MDDYLKKQMGQRIKEERLNLDLSQDALAEKLGMKRANVSNYEAGRVVPPGNILLEMSKIFNVSTDYLLCKTDTPNSDIESSLDDDIRTIQRGYRRMTNKDRKKMMNIIKVTFEEAFNEDEFEDDDEDI
ncbi:helix-turn-helix transcriptional regulator [Pullulanibacillus sp. KACC 23026]|uniref:helix-turn-helix domain-containing protein n=1 Tax=Pullulanibacillus sp. KACC 23026 TaxID=3028315 RepID=UPI0023B0DFF1|nr:helix-turn-helix transcriptional regulator [Pullulanibacillus sp. KACC 23026]WEG14114.1 helix-turn-helix transcriptional regulator [Pullulanibacillus sp. KACC 23026]